MYVPPSTGALLLGALLIGLEYWAKSFVSGLPKIACRRDAKTYWALRSCSWVAATVLLGLVFGFSSWTPLLALAYAAIASTERLLTRLQRCLATLTGSRLPWLQILPMLLLAVLAVFGSGLACSLSEPVAEFIVALVGPCRLRKICRQPSADFGICSSLHSRLAACKPHHTHLAGQRV